jgi:hypothetical protein
MFYINLTGDFPTRYDLAKYMEFSENVYDIVTSHMQREIPDLEFGGVYVVSGEEARPELIAYTIYGKTDYWWIVMTYNNLIKVEDVVEGMQLAYPSLSAIEALYFSLGNLQSEADRA